MNSDEDQESDDLSNLNTIELMLNKIMSDGNETMQITNQEENNNKYFFILIWKNYWISLIFEFESN